jgi:NAD(P)-dependent dehydrogenase (short-subunit alcohol dehydrogenase family)
MAEAEGHILVVGASSGIGRAVAERFAQQGAVTALPVGRTAWPNSRRPGSPPSRRT